MTEDEGRTVVERGRLLAIDRQRQRDLVRGKEECAAQAVGLEADGRVGLTGVGYEG